MRSFRQILKQWLADQRGRDQQALERQYWRSPMTEDQIPTPDAPPPSGEPDSPEAVAAAEAEAPAEAAAIAAEGAAVAAAEAADAEPAPQPKRADSGMTDEEHIAYFGTLDELPADHPKRIARVATPSGAAVQPGDEAAAVEAAKNPIVGQTPTSKARWHLEQAKALVFGIQSSGCQIASSHIGTALRHLPQK